MDPENLQVSGVCVCVCVNTLSSLSCLFTHFLLSLLEASYVDYLYTEMYRREQFNLNFDYALYSCIFSE